MDAGLKGNDLRLIRSGIVDRYSRAADGPEGLFRYPTGVAGLRGQGYDADLVERLPGEVAAAFCGVGNPFQAGEILPGHKVLDIGCGAGVDTFLAGMMAGADGLAVGVDLVPRMIDRAVENLQTLARSGASPVPHAAFALASAEVLPFRDGSFDAVISNGAFNLVPGKAEALREAFRALKPGGRFMIADQILIGAMEPDRGKRVSDWSR